MIKINKKYPLLTIFLFFIIGFLLFTNINSANAQNLQQSESFLATVGGGIGYDTNTTHSMFIGQIIQIALSLIGILFLILIIIGGYQWMTAGGNEETITKAKKRIINATSGLVITLAAYAISYFVIYRLLAVTGF
jgi:hypothetical protein